MDEVVASSHEERHKVTGAPRASPQPLPGPARVLEHEHRRLEIAVPTTIPTMMLTASRKPSRWSNGLSGEDLIRFIHRCSVLVPWGGVSAGSWLNQLTVFLELR